MSRILSRISMFTGQISSQALQLVQAQISSAVIRSNSELAEIVISWSTPIGGDTGPTGAVAAMTSPVFRTISRGSSGLPVACAGQTLVQRPHIVQASVSSSCFQVKSWTTLAPKVSSDVSARLGSGFIAPFGRSLSLRYMLRGDSEHVAEHRDRQDQQEDDEGQDVGAPQDLVPGVERAGRTPVDERGQRVADEAPPLEGGRALLRDPHHLGGVARQADEQEHPEDHGVLGLGLDPDAVRPLDVAPADGPEHAGEEDQPGGVGDERERLVGLAVEELERLGRLVVDLERGGDGEQDEEAEVDQRVHQPRGRVAEEGLHVDAAPVVGEAPRRVVERGASAVGRALLPVPHPEREQVGDVDEQDGRDDVEGHDERVRHEAEDLSR